MTTQAAFHIFVNDRRFAEAEGAKHSMTGAAIAALVQVPTPTMVIHRDSEPGKPEVTKNQTVSLKSGERLRATPMSGEHLPATPKSGERLPATSEDEERSPATSEVGEYLPASPR